jgi:hypothetical protein
MKGQERKAAVAAYKQRKAVAGIYAVRCMPTGQHWVGRTPDLGMIQNRIWFTLRHGSHMIATLQQAWNAHGSDAMTFEVLERFEEEEEELAYVRESALKERAAHWRKELNAAEM